MEAARAVPPGHVAHQLGARSVRAMARCVHAPLDKDNCFIFREPALTSGGGRLGDRGKGKLSCRSRMAQLKGRLGVSAWLEQEHVHKGGPGESVLIASTSTAIPHSTTLISPSEQHVVLLGFIACVAVGTLSCLFLAAIPTLLAFKKAAESLEKLADAAREELPGTMAAVRLSGLEISDLTMELSDLGQEISEGVRSSARAVRSAEDGLRRIGSAASKAPRIQNKGGGGPSGSGIRS